VISIGIVSEYRTSLDALDHEVLQGIRSVDSRSPWLPALALDKPAGDGRLAPFRKYDARPAYYIFGGLIFKTLTYGYLQAIEEQDEDKAPFNLVVLKVQGKQWVAFN
jgi:hypothetical protein